MAKIQKSFRLEEFIVNRIEDIPSVLGETETDKVERLLSAFDISKSNKLNLFTREEANFLRVGFCGFVDGVATSEKEDVKRVKYTTAASILSCAYNVACTTVMDGFDTPVLNETFKRELLELDEVVAIKALIALNTGDLEYIIKPTNYSDEKLFTISIIPSSVSHFRQNELESCYVRMTDTVGIEVLRYLDIDISDLYIKNNRARISIEESNERRYDIHINSALANHLFDTKGYFKKSDTKTIEASETLVKPLLKVIKYKDDESGNKYKLKYVLDEVKTLAFLTDNNFDDEILSDKDKDYRSKRLLEKAEEKRKEEELLRIKNEKQRIRDEIALANKEKFRKFLYGNEEEFIEEHGSSRLKLLYKHNMDYDGLYTVEFITHAIKSVINSVPGLSAVSIFVDLDDNTEHSDPRVEDLTEDTLTDYDSLITAFEALEYPCEVKALCELDDCITADENGLFDRDGETLADQGELATIVEVAGHTVYITNM